MASFGKAMLHDGKQRTAFASHQKSAATASVERTREVRYEAMKRRWLKNREKKRRDKFLPH
jgi:hypothetical protein